MENRSSDEIEKIKKVIKEAKFVTIATGFFLFIILLVWGLNIWLALIAVFILVLTTISILDRLSLIKD